MTLAARCPSCRTAFRVVRDQLRVSEGWVRCGRCAAVFDATQTLFEVDGAPAARELPAPPLPAATAWSEPVQPVALSVDELHAGLFGPQPADPAEPADTADLADSAGAADGLPSRRDDGPHVDFDPDPAGPAPLPSPSPADTAAVVPAPATASAAPPPVPALATAPPATPAADDAPAVAVIATADTPADAPVGGGAPIDDPAHAEPVAQPVARPAARPTPTFVREAERAARWRSTPVRLALGSAALLLAAAALLQGARAFHDPLFVHWPAARPVLDRLCPLAGCETGPRRLIEGLRIESSALVHLGDEGRLVRLTLTLRNRHPLPLQPPAVELTLTDARGDIVSRRVLLPAELGVRTDRIAAGGELTLRTALDTGELRVVGYSLEVFYP